MNMIKDLSAKDAILKIKKLYDINGIHGCDALLESLLKRRPNNTVFLKILFLKAVVDKIDTCTSNCWEDLESKKFFACECNDDPFVVPLDDDQEIGIA